jgi:hypothetical protein
MIYLRGKPIRYRVPKQAINDGICYITEDRKANGYFETRSDFMAQCRGVQPGGAEALQCLQRNSSQLSGSCRSAVAAIGTGAPPSGSEAAAPAAAPPGGPGPAVGPGPMPGPMPTLRPGEAFYVLRICGPDKRRLCGDVPPGGGRIIACLAENASNLSPDCAAALAAARR